MKYLFTIMAMGFSLPILAEVTVPSKEVACRACHGEGGKAPIAPNYPKLNGQNQAYLEAALYAYKNGDRKGALATVMAAQSRQLTPADITALAKYYATQ